MAPYSHGSICAQLARVCLIFTLLALPMVGANAERVAAPLIPLTTNLVPLGVSLQAVPCLPPDLPALATPAKSVSGPLPSAAFVPDPDGIRRLQEIEQLRLSDLRPIDGPNGRSPPSA